MCLSVMRMEKISQIYQANSKYLALLQGSTKEYLEKNTIGIDRGVKIPIRAPYISSNLIFFRFGFTLPPVTGSA